MSWLPITSNIGGSLIGAMNTVNVTKSVYSPSLTYTDISTLPLKFVFGVKVNKLLLNSISPSAIACAPKY